MKKLLFLFMSVNCSLYAYGQCNVPVTNLFVNICDSDTFTTAGNQNVTTAGVYLDTLQSALSCDSIIETTLTLTPRTTGFNYGGATSFCLGDTNHMATIATTTGGKFTASGGLIIDSLTGAIDLNSATSGTYDVTYTPTLVAQQIGQDIDGEATGDFSGWSVSMSSDGLTVAIGGVGNYANGPFAGHVRIYSYNGTAWMQIGQDIDGEATGDACGYSVSMSSDGLTVAIGAPSNDGNGINSGHVRIYSYNGGAWIQVGQDIDGETAADFSGSTVSMSSDGLTVAIGAYYNQGNGFESGHVRIYEYILGSWTQVGLDIDGEAIGDRSGESVSMSSDGSTVAIGASLNDGNGINAGHVRVYSYNGTAWIQVGLDIDGEAASDYSSSVSISSDGSTVAIGASGNDGNGMDAGHVRVYNYNGTAWTQTGQDIEGDSASDYSGKNVSMSSDGSTVSIGATGNDANGINAGHVKIYTYNGSAWTQVRQDIEGEAADDNSGSSLSMSSDGLTVAIGATGNDGNGIDAGHVRVLSLHPNCPLPLSIVINPAYFTQVDASICDNETYTTAGNQIIDSAGTYLDTLQSALSCDSVIETTLKINSRHLTQVSANICDDATYTFNGNNYNQAGVYLDTLQSALSCDSVIETTLNVRKTSATSLIVDTCSGIFSLTGKYFDATGIYFDTTLNHLGCDSIISYDLTINLLDNSVTENLNSSPTLLIANDLTANYQWLNCTDNFAIIPNETSRTFTALTNGSYAAEVSRGDCRDTSDCYLVQNVGLENNFVKSEIKLYPNPTNGIVTIDAKQLQKAEVFDATGRLIIKSKSNIINLERQPKGLYLIKVHTKGIIEEFKVLME